MYSNVYRSYRFYKSFPKISLVVLVPTFGGSSKKEVVRGRGLLSRSTNPTERGLLLWCARSNPKKFGPKPMLDDHFRGQMGLRNTEPKGFHRLSQRERLAIILRG